MPPTSKQVFRDLFGARAQRSLFIPWLWRYAARLEQISLEDMTGSPDLLSRSLVNAQKLFGYDAIVVCLDDTLEAEACGCAITWKDGEPKISGHLDVSAIPPASLPEIEMRGRLPVVVEAIRRVAAISGKNVPVLAGTSGPLTLASRLTGLEINERLPEEPAASRALDIAAKVAMRLAKVYCQAGADAIVLMEPGLSKLAASEIGRLRSLMAPVANVVRFYSAHTILLVKSVSGIEAARAAIGLGLDAVSPGSSVTLFRDAAGTASRQPLGYPLPEAAFRDGNTAQIISALLNDSTVGHSFMTTEWEVPVDTPPEILHKVIREWRSLSNPE